MNHQQERLVTAAQAAQLFGISRRQAYRWIETHNIAPVDAIPSTGARGSTTVYRLSDFAAAAAQRHAEHPKSHIPSH